MKKEEKEKGLRKNQPQDSAEEALKKKLWFPTLFDGWVAVEEEEDEDSGDA